MKLWLTQTRQAAAAFWAMRDARERKLLLTATAVVISALLYLLLIAPALTGRERLNKELPLLREQVALLQALSSEASSLSGQTETRVAKISKESLTAALAAHGLKVQNVSVTGEVAQVRLVSVSYAQTLGWLAELQKTSRVSVVEAKITALAQPDQIDATFTLHQAGNQ